MITLIALLRLIPYAIIVFFSFRKGYPRLATYGLYLMFLAVMFYFANPSPEVRSACAGFGAFLLMLHAFDLKGRR